MCPEDIEAVYRISCGSFSHPWSKDAIKKELSNPAASYFVATQEKEVIGYAGMWHMADEGEVINIAVSSTNRCKGIGAQLLEALLEEAIAHQLTSVFLEVRENNKTAQSLYKRHGFNIIGIRKRYYRDPEEDAILMSYEMSERTSMQND